MVEGLFVNIIKGRDSFAKRQKSGRALYLKNERMQGGMGIFALLFFLSLPRNRGERAARRRRPGPAARGARAALE